MTRAWVIAAALAVAANEAGAADAAVTTYTATYTVEYKGKQAGVSEWSVRDVGDGRYEFQARITPKGMLKLIRPKPTIGRGQLARRVRLGAPHRDRQHIRGAARADRAGQCDRYRHIESGRHARPHRE